MSYVHHGDIDLLPLLGGKFASGLDRLVVGDQHQELKRITFEAMSEQVPVTTLEEALEVGLLNRKTMEECKRREVAIGLERGVWAPLEEEAGRERERRD